MSSKQKTTQQQSQSNAINYDPGSKGVYNSLQGNIGSTLNDYMQDPLKSSFFNTNLQYAMKSANQQGRNNMSNFFQNLKAGGGGSTAMSPFQQAMLGQTGRANSALRASAFNQTLLDASGKRLQATAMAQGYQPLMTGSNSNMTGSSTSQTSGLGTWLPQLIGAGIGAAGAAMTGGASSTMASPSAGAINQAGALSGPRFNTSAFMGMQPSPWFNPGAMSGGGGAQPNPFMGGFSG